MADDFPCIVTPDQLRFEIRFAISQIPPSLWRQWVLGKELRSETAREMIITAIEGRFSRFEIREKAPAPYILGNIGNKS